VTTHHPGYLVFLLVTSVVAGVMNALAGGGTVLTFPTLLAAGVSPVAANATNAVALVPGSFTAGWGFRRELGASSGRVLAFLLGASLSGGLVGAWLVVLAGDGLFRALVPWLILGATALFIGGIGAAGYATRRDLSPLARASFWALVALIGFGIVLVFVQIPGGAVIYAVAGLVIFAGLTLFDFQRLRRTQDIRTAPLLASSIFLDVLNVFLLFLSLFGRDS